MDEFDDWPRVATQPEALEYFSQRLHVLTRGDLDAYDCMEASFVLCLVDEVEAGLPGVPVALGKYL